MVNNKSTPFSSSNPDTWSSLLTIEQVAQILNVSPWTLRQWDNKKKLIAVRIGNRKDRRYRKEDVLKILEQGMS